MCVPLLIEVLIDHPSQETESPQSIKTCQWLITDQRMSHLLTTRAKANQISLLACSQIYQLGTFLRVQERGDVAEQPRNELVIGVIPERASDKFHS